MSDIISKISTNGARFAEQHNPTVSSSDKQGMEINKSINPSKTAIPEATSNIWVSSAKEALAVIDIYNVDGKSVLTSYESLKKLMDSSVLDGFKKGGFSGRLDLFKQVVKGLGGALDSKAILDKVGAAVPGIKSILGQVPIDGKGFKDLFKDIKFDTGVFTELNGLKKFLPDIDIKDLAGLKKIADGLTGFDSKALLGNINIDAGLLGNTIKACAKTGMLDNIPKLLEVAKNKNVLLNVARDCLVDCGKTGNANLLLEVSKSLGKNGAISIDNNILASVAKAVTINTAPPVVATGKGTVADPDYKKFMEIHGSYGVAASVDGNKQYSEIKAAYVDVDNKWQFSKDVFAETGVLDARLLGGSSDGFKEVMISNTRVHGNDVDKMHLLGSVMPLSTVSGQLSTDFPLVLPMSGGEDVTKRYSANVLPFKPVGT